ncbi:carbohydrate sulfotransferase 8-like isoform X2 [Thalassophryne amazonica]|uniref:carbohydrate sulfotransferase 8-like isoform X2 n=1 Tax=Thalassophryne amazonica TaxID=390379 RepID=UPI001470FBC9|nr:carbohydrate sulfotransferase 8-like isoform X2 [Thalassophryne amazonica]
MRKDVIVQKRKRRCDWSFSKTNRVAFTPPSASVRWRQTWRRRVFRWVSFSFFLSFFGGGVLMRRGVSAVTRDKRAVRGAETDTWLIGCVRRGIRLSFMVFVSFKQTRTYYICVSLCCIMLWTEWRMVVDSLRGRRRMLPCFFWFLLLFATGGLVLFIHLQDLSEMVQHQGPGVKLGGALLQSRETLCTQDIREAKSDNYQDHRAAESILSSPIPPMQFPEFERTKQSATSGSTEQDIMSLRVTKRHRKLLKTSYFPAETWKKLSNIVEARRQLMKEMCAKYKSSISKTITRHHVAHIYVEDKYRLLYCQVPKAGCSNWKRTLMVLAGQASNAQNIKHDTVHYGNHLKRLDSFDRHGIMWRLETYTKLIFAREPLERLVSAYRDKFENPNNYYHSLFGKPIISKYRANASSAALSTGNGVTFQEFVQYLLDVHRPVGMDIHWEPANQLCNPCLLDYDFIGKFENMEEESNFFLRRAGAPRNLTLPSFKDRNPSAERTSMQITQKYFSQISAWERQRIYDFYYMDYLMFNYSKPFKDLY